MYYPKIINLRISADNANFHDEKICFIVQNVECATRCMIITAQLLECAYVPLILNTFSCFYFMEHLYSSQWASHCTICKPIAITNSSKKNSQKNTKNGYITLLYLVFYQWLLHWPFWVLNCHLNQNKSIMMKQLWRLNDWYFYISTKWGSLICQMRPFHSQQFFLSTISEVNGIQSGGYYQSDLSNMKLLFKE